MTLIKLPENNLKGVQKWKNAQWEEAGTTPNLCYDSDKGYRAYVDGFAAMNRIPGPYKFVEVRIVKQKASVVVSGQKNWWDDPLFMDKVFWVFMKPITDLIDNQLYTYYALEPKECVRVFVDGWKKYGGPPTDNSSAVFVVPTECVSLAWNETVGGISEHLHSHFIVEKELTTAEIDKRARLELDAERVLSNSFDIASDPRAWAEASERLRKINGSD